MTILEDILTRQQLYGDCLACQDYLISAAIEMNGLARIQEDVAVSLMTTAWFGRGATTGGWSA